MLLVEGKEFNVDGTRALVNDGRFPEHAAVVVQGGFGHERYFVVTVGAFRKQK